MRDKRSKFMAIRNLWLAARARNIELGWVSIGEPELINYGWQDRIDKNQTRFVR